MKMAHLKNMKKGWFIGDFEPSLFQTKAFEVAVKEYNARDYEECHFHKIATEFTVVIRGKVQMNGIQYQAGDIIIIEPNEVADFNCLEDGTVTVVVKIPSETGDKYLK